MSRTEENLVNWEKTSRRLVAKRVFGKVVQQHQEQQKLLDKDKPVEHEHKRKRPRLATKSRKKEPPATKKLAIKRKNVISQAKQCNRFATSRTVLNANEHFQKPCPTGFKRVVVQRRSGKTEGNFDTYYVTPDNKVLRSKPDAVQYLADHLELGKEIKAQDFDFSFKSTSFEIVTVTGKHQELLTKSACIQLTRCDDLITELGMLPVNNFADNNASSSEEAEVASTEDVYVDNNGNSTTEDSHVDTSEAVIVFNEDLNQSFVSSDSDKSGISDTESENDKKQDQWSKFLSPYHLIYEQPFVRTNLWKLMTSAIIIEDWRQSVYAYKFFQIFDEENVLDDTTQTAAEILKEAHFPAEFMQTYELIKQCSFSLNKALCSNEALPFECSSYVRDVIRIFHLNELKSITPTQFDLICYKDWQIQRM